MARDLLLIIALGVLSLFALALTGCNPANFPVARHTSPVPSILHGAP